MFEPKGPLPREIYWRRRALGAGIILVVLIVLIWIIVAVSGGSSSSDAASANKASASALASASADATAPPAPSGSAAPTGADGAPVAPAPSGSAASGATPATGQQCPDQSIGVVVSADQPNYQVGGQPVFTTVFTNIGSVPCVRDLSPGLQSDIVTTLDGTRRIWANSDCFPGTGSDVRTMNPGQQVSFRTTWSGTSSQPGCQGERVQVPAGGYVVTATLGPLRSAPVPFNVVQGAGGSAAPTAAPN